MQPPELQSISRLTTRADSLSVISSLLKVTLLISAAFNCFKNFLHSQVLKKMFRNFSLDASTDWEVVYVEHSSAESSPIRNNTPAIFNSTLLSGATEREAITISSVDSPEPQTVTIDSDSNEPTFPYGFGHQNPIVPPSVNDFNLPPNPFNVLATMALIPQGEEDNPQSPEPSDPFPISTPPRDVSTIEGWETPHTTTDDNTFYSSEGEPRRVYWDFSPNETDNSNQPRHVWLFKPLLHTAPSTTTNENTEHGVVFSSKEGIVAAHLRGMRPAPSSQKDTLMLRENLNFTTIC